MVKTSCESDNPKQTFSCTGLTFMEKRQISYLWARNRQHFEIWIKILTIRLWTLNRRSAWRLVFFFHAKNLMHTILSQIQIQKKCHVIRLITIIAKKNNVWKHVISEYEKRRTWINERAARCISHIANCLCFDLFTFVVVLMITQLSSAHTESWAYTQSQNSTQSIRVSLFSRSIQWDKR